jgi:hypothetical protein
MSEPVKIIVTAETTQAALALRAFVVQANSGLKSMVPAAATAASSLTQVRQTAMLTHEGFRTLSASAMLLGGTRFPELGMGVMGVTQGMRALRTAAMLTGLSMAELLIPIAAIAAVVAGGAYIWHEFNAGENEAAENAKKLAAAWEKLPKLLKDIGDAQKAGILSPGGAKKLVTQVSGNNGKQLYIDQNGELTENATHKGEIAELTSGPGMFGPVQTGSHEGDIPNQKATQEQIEANAKAQITANGQVTETQIEAITKLKALDEEALQKKLDGFEKEKAAVQDELKKKLDAMAQERQLASAHIGEGVNPFTPGLAAADDAARANLEVVAAGKIAAIDAKAKAESDKADLEVQKAYEAYLAEEAELDQQIAVELEKEAAAKERLSEEDERIQQREAALKIKSIEGNPNLWATQKAQLLLSENQARQASILSEMKQNDLDLVGMKNQEQKNKLTKQNLDLENELVGLRDREIHQQAQAGNWGAAFKDAAKGVQAWNQSLAQTVAGGALNLLQEGIHGMANAFTSVIMGTKSLGQAMSQLGQQMLSSFISMILDIAMEALVVIPLLTALGVLSGGSIPAAGAGVTIASVGTAQGAVMGMAALAEGGRPIPGQPHIVGEEGWELFVPDAAGTVYSHDQSVAMLNRRSAAPVAAGNGGGASPVTVKNIMVTDFHQAALEAMASPAGERIHISHARKNRIATGVAT